MKNEMTESARNGFDGNSNPHLQTSAMWYAHALGRYLHDTGRCVPRDVRMGRGFSIRANDMRFTFVYSAGRIEFSRAE
jgi:hypothetical protein